MDTTTTVDPCEHVCLLCGGCPDCCECTTITADLLLREVPWPIPDNNREKTA